MTVERLELNNFRNYETLDLVFSNDISILYGDNAQGKTNVLEAVYLCSTTKSHKGSKDKDMIKIGSDEAHLRMYFSRNDSTHKIDMHLKKSAHKGVAIDGIPARRSSDVYGLVKVVFFSPEDLGMIKNGPAERRRFLDSGLCQINRTYLSFLSKYNKTLDQRNNLLKQISFDKNLKDTLDVWDAELIKYGKEVINARTEFVKEINKVVSDIHGSISGGKEGLLVKYEPSVTAEDFEQKLKKGTERDIFQKSTGTGPHRDDVSFFSGDNNLKLFGSQGQQRTATLSLKFTEIEMIKRITGESPILLLDDVLSELDRSRQQSLLKFIDGIQTIITCTGLEEFVGCRKKINSLYKVTNGTIEVI